MRSGICMFCGCSHFNPCPAGCSWANREQTVCTECTVIRNAFVRTVAAAGRVANFAPMARAFFRGFVTGSGDERATDFTTSRYHKTNATNPYGVRGRSADRRRFWDLGFKRGAAWRERNAA